VEGTNSICCELNRRSSRTLVATTARSRGG
jgi:hypothetical protein